MNTAQPAVLTKIGFQALIDTLRKRGYRILGPTVRDGAIVYDDIGSLADLPRGWTDEQGTALPAPHRADEALFGYAVGPHSGRNFCIRRGSSYGRPSVRNRACMSDPNGRRTSGSLSSACGPAISTRS